MGEVGLFLATWNLGTLKGRAASPASLRACLAQWLPPPPYDHEPDHDEDEEEEEGSSSASLSSRSHHSLAASLATGQQEELMLGGTGGARRRRSSTGGRGVSVYALGLQEAPASTLSALKEALQDCLGERGAEGAGRQDGGLRV